MGIWKRAFCAGVFVLAGCSAENPPPSDEPLPKVEHPKAAIPQNRDERAVLAAMRQLDVCALVDPARGVVVPGFPADRKPRAMGPFSCTIESESGDVRVKITQFSHEDRYAQPLYLIGGAKAYVKKTGSEKVCEVSLPVSFSMAIVLSTVIDAPGDPCAGPRGFAQVAVDTLANPDVNAVAASWDACTVLTSVAGDGSTKFRPGLFGIETCTAVATGLSLHFNYGWAPDRNTRYEMVGGKWVAVSDDSAFGPECSVAWRHGTARSAYPAKSTELWTSILVADCVRAKALAEQVMKVMAVPPPADVAPQRPVLYGSGEADVPAPGACAYWAQPENCQPNVDVPVPPDGREIVRRADADPNVDCALGRDAVAKHFGDQLKPVTVQGVGCQFLQPTRSFRLSIVTNWVPLSKTSDPDERDVTIAGHPGQAHRSTQYYRVNVSFDRNADEHGILAVSLEGTFDEATAAKLEPTAADIVGKYFNRPRR